MGCYGLGIFAIHENQVLLMSDCGLVALSSSAFTYAEDGRFPMTSKLAVSSSRKISMDTSSAFTSAVLQQYQGYYDRFLLKEMEGLSPSL